MMLRAETVSLKLSLESNFYEWDIEARKNSYDVTILWGKRNGLSTMMTSKEGYRLGLLQIFSGLRLCM